MMKTLCAVGVHQQIDALPNSRLRSTWPGVKEDPLG